MKKLILLLALAACSHFPDTNDAPSSPAPVTSQTSSNLTAWQAAAAGGGTTGTGDRTVSITPATNTLLVAFASLSANTQTSATMTDNEGGTYTQIGQAYWSGSTNNMFAFVRNSLVATSVATTLTLDTNTNTAGELEVVAFTGMTKTGSAAIKQIVVHGNQPANDTASLVFPNNVASSNTTIVAVGSADYTGVGTLEPTGWTEREDRHQTSPITSLEVATKDSGFSGTTITYGGSQDTSFAEIGIELDGSAPPPPVDAGVDASQVADASPDASSPDASAVDASSADAATVDSGGGGASYVGAHGMTEEIWGAANPSTLTLNTQTSGSTFLVLSAGNTSDVNRGPTDNKGNTYTKLDGVDYANWPGSGAYVWLKKNATGGTSTTWSQYVTSGTENVTFAVEVANAGSNPTIIESLYQHDNSGAYVDYGDGYLQCPGDAAGTHHCVQLTSNSVTTTGPATLVAWWLGAGATGYGNHVTWVNNGFTITDGYGTDNLNGLVQGFMAVKTVTSAGTYDVTWTYKPPQGAILYLVAVQP